MSISDTHTHNIIIFIETPFLSTWVDKRIVWQYVWLIKRTRNWKKRTERNPTIIYIQMQTYVCICRDWAEEEQRIEGESNQIERNNNSIKNSMGHHCCGKQKVKRGLWSPEEDEKLIKHLATHGHGCWSSVPKLAGTCSYIYLSSLNLIQIWLSELTDMDCYFCLYILGVSVRRRLREPSPMPSAYVCVWLWEFFENLQGYRGVGRVADWGG